MPTRRSRKVGESGKRGLQPAAFPQIAVRLRDLSQGCDQKSDGQIGDFVVQHVRRVGDDDAAPRRLADVHIVVADAVGWR